MKLFFLNKRYMATNLLIALSSCLFVSINVRAQVVEILTLGAALNQLDSTLQNAIASAGYEGRFTAFSAAQNGHQLIEHIREVYKDSLDKSINGLQRTEQKAYEDARGLIEDLSKSLNDTTGHLQKVTENINNSILDLPFQDKRPVIYRYTPKLVSGQGNAHVYTQIVGHGFIDKAQIKIDGERYEAQEFTNSALTFSIPMKHFVNDKNSVSLKRADLTATYYSGGFLGFLKDKLTAEYSLVFYSLPPKIGDYSFSITHIVPTSEIVVRSKSMEMTAKSWNEDSHDCLQVFATTGWTIDQGSIRWVQGWNDNGQMDGIKNANGSGFCVDLTAKGKGLFNGRGKIIGEAVYTEYKVTESEVKEDVSKNVPLFWGQDVLYDLPKDTKSFSITVVSFDSKSRSATGTLHEELFDVDYNAPARQVVIRPTTIDKAVIVTEGL